MKKIYFTFLTVIFLSQVIVAQQPANLSKPEFETYQKNRIKEVDEQHRIVKAYFSSANVEDIFAKAAEVAGVSKSDYKDFHDMLREKYFYSDKNTILKKINRNELNDANVNAYIDSKIKEYASYYRGAFLIGKTTLLENDAPKIKMVQDKGMEQYLSERLGTPVVLSASCGNVDFEAGSFAGWFGANYNISAAWNCGLTTPNPMPNPGFNYTAMNNTGNEHGLCNGGTDPSVTTTALPCVSPFAGGTTSCRLGDVTDGCGAAQMSFSFTVTNANINFTYDYAAILYDGHLPADAPKIQVSMIDLSTGQPIGCAAYSIDATQAAQAGSGYFPADNLLPGLYYKPWSQVFVPLSGYIGKNVQVNLLTTDCDGTAHRGYAYFDFHCSPFFFTYTPPVNCVNPNGTITAPAGASTYAWGTIGSGTIVGSTTTQSVTVSASGDYQVTMTAFGSGCSYTIDTTISIIIPPTPVASFSATTVCVGTPTQFTDSSYANGGPPLSGWSWTFGDGGTSTAQNPTHTYASTGNYTAVLTVTNSSGCTSTHSITVTVNPGITPVFTAPTVCLGTPTVFTDNTPGATTYNWSFGDGGTSTVQNPSHTYATAGSFVVTESVVTGGGCTGSVTHTITVSPNITPVFTAPTVCLGTATTFTDNTPGATTYNWSFGDGGTSTVQNPSHTYATAGSFVVTESVTTGGGCSGSVTNTVTVNPPITPSFTSPPVCYGSATVFTDNTAGAVTWSWSFGDGGTSTVQNPTHTYASVGTFAVTESVTAAGGCSGTVTVNVIVKPIPVLTVLPNINVCEQQQVAPGAFVSTPVGATVGWNNSNTTIGLGANGAGNIPPFTGTTGGSTTPVTGTVTAIPTLNGCVGPPITFNITVAPQPTLTLASPPLTCPGQPVPAPSYTIVPNDPNTAYSWLNNNTAVGLGGAGTGIPPGFTAAANNTLSNISSVVTVTPSLYGCVGPPANYTLTIYPTPVINPVADIEKCPNVNIPAVPFTVQPTNNGVPVFLWSNTNTSIGLPANGNGSPLPGFTSINGGNTSQVAAVSVSASLNGCPAIPISFNITIDPNPVAVFASSPKICEGNPMNFYDESTVGTGNIISAWAWDFNNDGITDATAQNPQYLLTPAGWYTVALQVTTSKGCIAKTTEPVYVNYNPVPNFAGDVLSGCPIHPVNYTESSTVTPPAHIISWNWTFGNGTTSTLQIPGTIFYNNTSPVQSAFYTVSLSVKTDSGCAGAISKTNYITVYPHPIANFNWGPQNPEPDIMSPIINFTDESIGASGPNSYGPSGMMWYLGDTYLQNLNANYVNNIQNPVHSYEYEGPNIYQDGGYIYYVTQWVQNIYGCKDSITKPVEIQPVWTFYIPNAFSPNGDGTNEGFKGTGIGIDNTTYNLWVFDRWGNMIFYSNDLEKTWDGRIQGKGGNIVQEDVYVWKVKFHDFRGMKHEYKGIVSVVK